MYKITKRTFDFVMGLVGFVVLSPLLATVAFLVHRRLGTMLNASDEHGTSLPDEQRLTEFGKLLRSTSLDELPELWNIICGHMSFVGPRPLLMQYLDRYTPEQARRHDVRPGLTGYAQVNGRNAITWDERFALDNWYVDNRSFKRDLAILLATFRLVWRREGVSASGEATMPEFGLNKARAETP
jgi:sugar transferase EpsL